VQLCGPVTFVMQRTSPAIAYYSTKRCVWIWSCNFCCEQKTGEVLLDGYCKSTTSQVV